MRTREWWFAKANAIAPAIVGGASNIPAVAALLAVATHETSCGDAWPGSHNWGATTIGSLTQLERNALAAAHVSPVLSPREAREASELAAERVVGGHDDREIHVDSRPRPAGRPMLPMRMGFHAFAAARALATPTTAQIVYFTWFAKFADDARGAAYFVSFFRSAAERYAIATGDVGALARAMYLARYYTGFSTDSEVDIADYAGALRPLQREAIFSLAGWTPGAVPEVEPAQGVSWGWVQRALNASMDGTGLVIAQLLDVDGIPGPKTRAMISAYQRSEGIPVTSFADDATVQALRGPEAAA